MNKLGDKFREAVSRFSMLAQGDRVIVALSGGADSVALLNILNSNKEKYNIDLYAAHLNHNLRGAEADRDEQFVRDLCARLGVELFVRGVDIKTLSQRQGIGTELCGRNERYAFFAELSDRLGAKIATAHTASDNAETVIFNLTRGAGPNGFSGIRPVRDNIIRPLILCTRADVEAYCADEGLSFVTDSTNLTDDYTRNKLRHGVIPVLREINPDFENTVLRESGLMTDINSFLELKSEEIIAEAETENGWDCAVIASCPDALRLSVLRLLCARVGIDAELSALVLLSDCLSRGGALDIRGVLRAECRQGTLRFVKKRRRTPLPAYNDCVNNINRAKRRGQAVSCKVKNSDNEMNFSPVELKLDSEFMFNGNQYSVKEIKSDVGNDVLKAEVLALAPIFRTRREGDRFTLPRRRVTKSLKKLFNEMKIPAERRNSLLLLADGSEILWIEGLGACEKYLSRGGGIKIIKNG